MNFEIENGVLQKCSLKKKEIIIPDGVTHIASCAFEDLNKLEKIVFPSSLIKIELQAFRNLKALKEVVFKDSPVEIGYEAFAYCHRLNKVDLGNAVRKIEDGVFENCLLLETILIPKSVTYIGKSVFDCCSRLTVFLEAPHQPETWNEEWKKGITKHVFVWGFDKEKDSFSNHLAKQIDAKLLENYTFKDSNISDLNDSWNEFWQNHESHYQKEIGDDDEYELWESEEWFLIDQYQTLLGKTLALFIDHWNEIDNNQDLLVLYHNIQNLGDMFFNKYEWNYDNSIALFLFHIYLFATFNQVGLKMDNEGRIMVLDSYENERYISIDNIDVLDITAGDVVY